jgi:aspartate carbamoyltransferase catalytic subunit
MPDSILDELRKSGNEIEILSSTADYISNSDVLYATRVQKERFQDLEEYETLRKAFCITPETMRYAKEKMILMHPFPRVGEISMEVDQDPRAAYFRQIQNGLHVRMALLAMVLGDVL